MGFEGIFTNQCGDRMAFEQQKSYYYQQKKGNTRIKLRYMGDFQTNLRISLNLIQKTWDIVTA